MHTISRTGLFAAAFLSLGLGASAPALAAATMCGTAPDTMKTDTMKQDDMSKDTMSDGSMSKESMSADAMSTDTMSDDGMSKDDMAKDGMGKDGMGKDDMATGKEMMMADYTVMAGDSLWSIARKTLCDGNRYPEIVAANKDMLGGSMTIRPGEVLHIPGD